VRTSVASLLVLSAGILIGACSGEAPARRDTTPAAAPPRGAAAIAPAERPATPIESGTLEDADGAAAVIADTIAEPLPPELAEHVPNFVIRLSRLWTPGQALRVCFFQGAPELRERIRQAATAWTAYANIKLDFGQQPGLRTCVAGDLSQIRVGFAYAGYWSVVGNTPVRRDLQTMNYGGFDTAPPIDPRFRGVVMHEFGHALGFEHEHQHPQGGCDAEFNWPVVYSELAKPPNRWSREKVDFNLRAFTDTSAFGLSMPDRTSIMHYSLDSWMFLAGERSKCYVAEQDSLSELDKRGAASVYPAQADRMLADQRRRIDQLLRSLPPDADAARRYLDNIGKLIDARKREVSRR